MRLKANKNSQTKSRKFTLLIICTFFLVLGIFLGWKNVPGFLKANFVLLTEARIIDALTQENNLDTINLDISFKNLQKIENKRSEAIEKQRLISSDEDFVKAYISHNGHKYKCEVRLKGDLSDHWSGDKISLRVEMKNGNIYGLSDFSIQRHGTRQDTGQWLYLQSLKKEGLMAVDYHFVNFFLNGKHLGVYGLEGHFSKDIFEKNKKRESVILSFDESKYWEKNFNLNSAQFHSKLLHHSEIKVRKKNQVNKNNFLKDQKVMARNMFTEFLNKKSPAEEVFEKDSFGKFLALTRVWNAEHALDFHNINFYFNPIICKFELIGFDGFPGHSATPSNCFLSEDAIYRGWLKIALLSEELKHSYLKYLYKFSDPKYLNSLKKNLEYNECSFRNLIVKNLILESAPVIWNSAFTIFTRNIWDTLGKRTKLIRRELENLNPIKATLIHDDKKNYLIVKNLTRKPIFIEEISFNSKKKFLLNKVANENLNMDGLYVNESSFKEEDSQELVKFSLQNDFIMENNITSLSNIKLHGRIAGSNFEFNVDVHFDHFVYNYLDELSLIKEDNALPSFFTNNTEEIIIKPGTYTINQPIYIETSKPLIISAGTRLLMGNDVFIISKAPIVAKGTIESPITFGAVEDSWAGLLSTAEYNSFSNVIFENAKGIGNVSNPNGTFYSGWNLTGGITIFNSTTEFQNCNFRAFTTEDALNIISSTFTLSDCNFSNHYSDAFDGDFVTGKVLNCKFSEILGDAADFSGSEVEINNCYFNKISDKAISVGESSSVKIINSKIVDVSFGVVSKDMSKTEVMDNTEVKFAKIAAFSAFQKKDSFGPASIKISDSKILDCKRPTLIQTGSRGSLDGKTIETVSFQSSDLYKNK